MKKRKIIIPVVIMLAAIAAAIVFAVIRHDYAAEKYNGELYFFNESMTAIESENHEVRYKDRDDLLTEVIEEIAKGPDNGKHMRIIERKTQLLSVEGAETGNIVVNFSGEFLTGDSAKDILAVYAVVKSLCAIEGIESVKVVIEGRDIYTDDGSIIGYLTNQDINLATDTYNSEMREITLYFPSKDNQKLIRETRIVKVNDQQPIARYIINELIKGSSNENAVSALNAGTVLLNVETSNNICFVSFKSNFIDKNSGSAEKEIMTIYSIVNSLTELDFVERVQFLMDGKKVDSFGNVNIGSMFGRDESIIE
ncbi:MAG: GerMN domain-containing protein [Clostridia bacterium]|nr:GerMN domain-containing protein [Clostridia bacterium]